MNPKEHELLRAMGDCYKVCQGSFEETLSMISGWRGYTTEEVRLILLAVREKHGVEPEYIELRSRFPEDFPV
ncbi:MAG: hypothetical protein ACFFE8_03010 [Candidatus Heimdallarchaeota archaeon]